MADKCTFSSVEQEPNAFHKQTNKSRGLRLNEISPNAKKPVLREIHFDEFVTYKMKSPEERKYFQDVTFR